MWSCGCNTGIATKLPFRFSEKKRNFRHLGEFSRKLSISRFSLSFAQILLTCLRKRILTKIRKIKIFYRQPTITVDNRFPTTDPQQSANNNIERQRCPIIKTRDSITDSNHDIYNKDRKTSLLVTSYLLLAVAVFLFPFFAKTRQW